MADRPYSRVLIGRFKGLLTNADPQDIAAEYCVEMSNFTAVVPGELRSRSGFVPETLTGGSQTSTSDIIAGTVFRTPVRQWVVYELEDGSVMAGYL